METTRRAKSVLVTAYPTEVPVHGLSHDHPLLLLGTLKVRHRPRHTDAKQLYPNSKTGGLQCEGRIEEPFKYKKCKLTHACSHPG